MIVSLGVGLVAVGLPSAPASARSNASATSPRSGPAVSGPTTVDQNVEDVDPRARSLRQIDPGNARLPTRSMITRNPHHASWRKLDRAHRERIAGQARRQYTFRTPGVRALVDRPEYVTIDQSGHPNRNAAAIVDGAFQEVIPPNTVFNLIPDHPAMNSLGVNSAGGAISPRAKASGGGRPRLGTAAGALRGAFAQQARPATRRVDGRVRRRLNTHLTSVGGHSASGAGWSAPASPTGAVARAVAGRGRFHLQASRRSFAQIVRERIGRQRRAHRLKRLREAHTAKPQAQQKPAASSHLKQ